MYAIEYTCIDKHRKPWLECNKDTYDNLILFIFLFLFFFRKERNILEAAAAGASASIILVANIAANLIAFLAMLAFVNAIISWFGSFVCHPELTFQVGALSFTILWANSVDDKLIFFLFLPEIGFDISSLSLKPICLKN